LDATTRAWRPISWGSRLWWSLAIPKLSCKL